MTDNFSVPATDEAHDFLLEIAARMALLLPVTHEEAVARIERFWDGHEFLTEGSVNALFHEDATFWAKTIYYGRHVMWWLGEDDLTGEPYP